MTITNRAITYVLRCHSLSALPKLKVALLSVAGQSYEEVKAFIAVQNLPDDAVKKIAHAASVLHRATGLEISLVNFHFSTPGDHRGELLNKAIREVDTRYVAFLDYDDVVYPNHAECLIADLMDCENKEAVASFGGVTLAYYDDVSDGSIYITRKHVFSQFPSVLSCVIENCFPIHSYVIDLQRISSIPKFGEQSSVFEDYLFLLELFRNYSVSTNKANIALAEYRLNNDNSNTVRVKTQAASEDTRKELLWEEMEQNVEQQKYGRPFYVPYSEITKFVDASTLTRQPFFRGLVLCSVAKRIRKNKSIEEAAQFLRNPKAYVQLLPASEKTILMRLFF